MKKLALLFLLPLSVLAQNSWEYTWDYPLFDRGHLAVNPSSNYYEFESELRKDYTVLNELKNTGQNFINVDFANHTYKILQNKGKGPQYLKNNVFDLTILNSLKGKATVRPLIDAGNAALIEPDRGENGVVRFNLGKQDTPWYLLEFVK